MYHGIVPDEEEDSLLRYGHVQRSAFLWEMRWLKRHARVLPLWQAVETLRAGERFPARATVLTFDDGFRNNADVAFPILRVLDLPATFFVATGHLQPGTLLWMSVLTAKAFVEAPAGERLQRLAALRCEHLGGEPAASVARAYGSQAPEGVPEIGLRRTIAGMSSDQLRQLSRSPLVEIGSHSVTHALLTRCDAARLQHELCGSKEELERITGKAVRLFAYPRDDHNEGTVDAVRRAGYAAAAAVARAPEKRFDLFRLPRTGIYGSSRVRFLAKWLGLERFGGAARAQRSAVS